MIKLQSYRLCAEILLVLVSLQIGVPAQGQTPVPNTAPQSPRHLQLEPCRNQKFDDAARCGKYEVFENRAAKAGRKIQLNLMVLPALNSQHAKDPIFFLAGGPGQGAVSAAAAIGKNFLSDLRRDRDIVLVDQRGTGGSHQLNCTINNGPDDFFPDQLFPPDRIRACRAELEKDADLTLYTTTIAMDDLDEIREALGYDRVNLYGGSYGTNAAFVYLRQHPKRVRSVVLSGVAPVDYKLPLPWAKGVQHALDRLFEDCAAEESCRKSFPKLREDLAAALAQLEKAPVSFSLPNPATGQTQSIKMSSTMFREYLRGVLYSPEISRSLPLVLHYAAGGEFRPFGGLALEYSKALRASGLQVALGMHFSVICAEHVPFITEAEMARETAGTFYGAERIRAQIKVCESWPSGKVSATFVDPVKSDVPVLMISGDLDPVSPPWLAAAAARHLPNSRQIVLRNASHFSGSECVNSLIAKFIDRGAAEQLDASCVEQIKRPSFITEEMAAKMAERMAGKGEKLDVSKGVEEWQGALDVGAQKLRLVLRVAKKADGTPNGELVSVDQGNVSLPIDTITYQGTVMRFDVKMVGGSFEGDVKNDGAEISGNWKQGGVSLPLIFKRTEKTTR